MMPSDHDPISREQAISADIASLPLYLATAVAYVTLGVLIPELLFSWVEGAAFLLLGVWGIPALAGARP